MSPGQGAAYNSPAVAPRRGRTPGKDKNKIGTPARGDIMRGVNIHVDFVMIQCTKNKKLTPLIHPLCHPAIRRGSVNFYSIPPVPPLRGFTGGYHMPPRHAARLQDSARLRLPSSLCGLRRGMRHLPDKLKFIALLHLSTVIFNSAAQKIRTATGKGSCPYIKIAFKRG